MTARNCLSCANRVKSDYGAAGSDFWRCTAVIVMPEFVLHHLREGKPSPMRLMNLNLFREGAPTYPGLQRDCPLHTDPLPISSPKE